MKRFLYWLKRLRSDIIVLYYAYKDPRVPAQAKLLIMLLAAYVISPVDLFPDFVFPGLGYLDDMVLIPLGADFILKMIPEKVISEARYKAVNLSWKVKNWAVILAFLTIIVLILIFAYR